MKGDSAVAMQVGPLFDVVYPLLLPSSPAVLSIGRRVEKEGYSFVWMHGKKPYLVRPDGIRIELRVESHIPYLIEYECNAAPSPEDSKEPDEETEVEESEITIDAPMRVCRGHCEKPPLLWIT